MRGRRGGRQLRSGADEPVEVRELPGRSPARPRRERDERHRAASHRSRTATAIYNDIAAPGLADRLDPPAPAHGAIPACADQGYSSCGPDEYREAQGTSFAAPQVTAAAAVLLSLRPTLRPEQVTRILQSTARSISNASTGCSACADGPRCVLGLGTARRRRGDRGAVEAAPATRTPTRPTTMSARGRTPPSEPNRRIRATRRLLG